jgi:hypothetical protein
MSDMNPPPFASGLGTGIGGVTSSPVILPVPGNGQFEKL